MMDAPGSECPARPAIGKDGLTAQMTWKETRHR